MGFVRGNLGPLRLIEPPLDELPRPTLVTCRGGPRSSGLVYLYAGLRAGAPADEVIASAEADDAPFTASPEIIDWVRRGLADLA